MENRHARDLDEAFGEIEESILPSLSLMLDALLDAAALARSGADAEACAAELRSLALQLDRITRQVEVAGRWQAGLQAAGAPCPASASAA
jgi:hypothetical protein